MHSFLYIELNLSIFCTKCFCCILDLLLKIPFKFFSVKTFLVNFILCTEVHCIVQLQGPIQSHGQNESKMGPGLFRI